MGKIERGMVCRILHSDFHSNIGKLCLTMETDAVQTYPGFGQLGTWKTKALTPITSASRSSFGKLCPVGVNVIVPEAWLEPLPPLPLEEDETAHKLPTPVKETT